jgi:hypothetical protein
VDLPLPSVPSNVMKAEAKSFKILRGGAGSALARVSAFGAARRRGVAALFGAVVGRV